GLDQRSGHDHSVYRSATERLYIRAVGIGETRHFRHGLGDTAATALIAVADRFFSAAEQVFDVIRLCTGLLEEVSQRYRARGLGGQMLQEDVGGLTGVAFIAWGHIAHQVALSAVEWQVSGLAGALGHWAWRFVEVDQPELVGLLEQTPELFFR